MEYAFLRVLDIGSRSESGLGAEAKSRQVNKPVVSRLAENDPLYPTSLKTHMAQRAPASVYALGNVRILNSAKLALFAPPSAPAT